MAAEPRLPVVPASFDTPASGDLKASLQQYEAGLIRGALERAGWNRTEAAAALGLPVRTLSHKMKKLGVERPPGGGGGHG